MDWLAGMNQAVAYIEEHLTLPISYETLGHMVGCSSYEFARVFSFIAQMPLSDYIRYRRLTQAAYSLQQKHTKVIDVALQYGYESATAFSRAFKAWHGITPAQARLSHVSLKVCPPISFTLTVK